MYVVECHENNHSISPHVHALHDNSIIQCTQVKDFISRAKAWRNKVWSIERGGDGKPSSYLMSLLVLKAYEIGGSDR